MAAREIAELDDEQRQFAVHWLDVVRASNTELAYHFICLADIRIDEDATADARNGWCAALDVYDRQGLFPATTALSELDAFIEQRASRERAVGLESMSTFLERYLRGLSGRSLRVAAGDSTHTRIPRPSSCRASSRRCQAVNTTACCTRRWQPSCGR
jgi:nitric oxide reductase NorD protein